MTILLFTYCHGDSTPSIIDMQMCHSVVLYSPILVTIHLCISYEYKMAREYNWNVKNKASKGYEVFMEISSFTILALFLFSLGI